MGKNSQKPFKERRQYYRLQPSMPEKVEARVFFLDGQTCQAEVVNFSPAGALCFCSQHSNKFHVGDVFPRIDIQIPHKPVVSYSGKLVRKELTADPKAFYFAIKFEKFGGRQGVRIPSQKKNTPQKEEEWNAVFLTRLRQAENFTRASDFHEESKLRNHVYQTFQDITANLRLEEKWFFLEILDELKRQEPHYSAGLLEQFLRFCREAERAQDLKSTQTASLSLKSLFYSHSN